MIMQSDFFMNKFIPLTLILPQFIITIGYNMVLGFGPMVQNISSNDFYLFGVQFCVLCSCLHNLCTTPRHPTFHQLPASKASKGGSKFNWKKKSTLSVCLSVCQLWTQLFHHYLIITCFPLQWMLCHVL